MTLGPYTTSTLDDGFIRYGNWTGEDYSANALSPAFIALTPAQEVDPGFDAFDAVSAVHDKAYDAAQQALLANLQDGVSGSTAMVTYLTALEQADRSFVAAAPTAQATTPWGQTVQQISVDVISVKADWEAADIQRIQQQPAYAAQLDTLATPASTQKAIADINSFDQTNATLASVAAYKTQLYTDSPFLAQTQDANVAVSGSVEDPALVPEILSRGGEVSLYLGNSVVDGIKGDQLNINGDTISLTGSSGSFALYDARSMTFFPGSTSSPFQALAAEVAGPDLIKEFATAIDPAIGSGAPLSAQNLASVLPNDQVANALLSFDHAVAQKFSVG